MISHTSGQGHWKLIAALSSCFTAGGAIRKNVFKFFLTMPLYIYIVKNSINTLSRQQLSFIRGLWQNDL